jgi:hypothetical protein
MAPHVPEDEFILWKNLELQSIDTLVVSQRLV